MESQARTPTDCREIQTSVELERYCTAASEARWEVVYDGIKLIPLRIVDVL